MDGEPTYYDVHVDLPRPQPNQETLTKREQEILKYLFQGKTSKQIAEELFVSKLTVDGHRKEVLRKMNCESTVDLLIKVMV